MDSKDNLYPNNNQDPSINNTKKLYYFNETKTKIMSYLGLILLMPLNIYFYNKGIYGETYIELGFLLKKFITEGLIYDIPFIILIFYGAVKLIKDVKEKDKTKVIITPKYIISDVVYYSLISLAFLIIYFKFPLFNSIALFLSMIVIIFITLFSLIRELTKKEYIQDNHQE